MNQIKVAIPRAHKNCFLYAGCKSLSINLGLNAYVFVNIIHSLITTHHLSTSSKNPADGQPNDN